jgi:NADH-quinone oxidoreductase subunit D
VLVGELERIHSHLLWLGVAGHEIGFDTLLMYSWRDRELVMDLLAALTGNRVNYGFNVLGGVKRDLSDAQRAEVLTVVAALEARTRYYIEVASEETTLIQRLCKVGYLSREDVLRLGTVGPTARASDVPRDTRRDDPYLVYAEIPFDVVTDTHGDVYGRTLVRVGELLQSYRIIRHICENLPEGAISPKKVPRKIPAGEAVGRYEAPRGEDVHYVRANGTERPERVKVRAPTLANLQSVPRMLEANSLADVPITLAAIDPCFSCTDRMVELVEPDGRRRGQLTWEQLRQLGIAHYRRAGIDFGAVARRWQRPAEEGPRR